MNYDKVDMTLVDMANRNTERILAEREERERNVRRSWLAIRVLFCIPCGAFAFMHIHVFLYHWRQILEAGGVLACLLVLATTWLDIREEEER